MLIKFSYKTPNKFKTLIRNFHPCDIFNKITQSTQKLFYIFKICQITIFYCPSFVKKTAFKTERTIKSIYMTKNWP
jgi:hypothetical protein